MKVTIIGMWGGFPKKGEPCSGYLLEHDGYSILIDCGSGVLVKLQEFIDLNDIHDVVISHYHYDHSSDVGAYLFSRLVNTQLGRVERPLTIYAPDDDGKKREYTSVLHTKFHSFNEETELNLGPFQLSFLKTIHPVETYAMKVTCGKKCLVYTADTAYFKELVQFAEESDLLITECSLYKGMDGRQSGHMNAAEAGILSRKSKAKKTILTHLPHYGNLQELLLQAREEAGDGACLAEPGMVVEC